MKIWQKLTIAFGSTSFLLGTIGLLTIGLDKQVQSETNETVHGIVEEAKAASKIFTSIQSIQELNQDLLINSEIDPANNLDLNQYKSKIESQLNLLENNIKIALESIITHKQIIFTKPGLKESEKKAKIAEEKEEIEQMNQLLEEVKLYRQEWQSFIADSEQNEQITLTIAKINNQRINQIIFPLVREYYEDSLEEITEAELLTEQLTSQNIIIIKNYVLFSFAVSLILFIYLYRSIYAPIKQLKQATFELGQNFSEYQPIKPKNPDDELGDLIKYFNETIAQLKTKIISKSYLDNIINSINQSLIVIDLESKISKINYNTSELLGYSESELVGKSIDCILSSSNSLKIDELIALDNLSSRCFSLDLITKKSREISVTVYFSDLYDEKGTKKGTICLAMSVENLSLSEIVALQKSKEKAKKFS